MHTPQTTIGNSGADNPRGRRRLQLVLLALLFMAPVVAAWVAWKYVGEHGIGATINVGELVTPARPLQPLVLAGDDEPLPPDLLHGRWTLVMFAPQGCEAACTEQLHQTRQVRLSLSKDVSRVQRLLVLDAPPSAEQRAALAQAHADLVTGWSSGGDWRDVARQFMAVAPADGSHVFLVDPLGNLMMVYGPATPAEGMLRDLRKLLKISQVG